MANILKGNVVRDAINEKSRILTQELISKGVTPTLAIFRVGTNKDDILYENGIAKRCSELGINIIKYEFDENVRIDEFCAKIIEANNNDNIHGILVFRPLPKRFDDEFIRNLINSKKDIDGCGNASLAGVFTNTEVGFAPCTAQSALEILDYYGIDVKGKNIVVLGRSLVVGKPLSMLLLNRNATVTICHTKTDDIRSKTLNADIVVCAIGQMESLDSSYFRKGQTIIDVGISWNEEKQKVCGDVLYEDVERLVENITPVPGGVGTVTTAVLISHVVEACKRKMDD